MNKSIKNQTARKILRAVLISPLIFPAYNDIKKIKILEKVK